MMVYVWTLSDPETRVKIQGDSRSRLGSPGLSVPSVSGELAGRHGSVCCVLPAPAGHERQSTLVFPA